MRRIHIKNGGIDSQWEFVGCGVKIQSMDDLNNEMKKAINDSDLKRVQELLNNCRSTVKTWKRVECGSLEVYDVYNELRRNQDLRDFESEISRYLKDKSRQLDQEGRPLLRIKPIDCNRKIFDREGLLFIDNLSCYGEDKSIYDRIATHLINRYKETNSSNWLICYVHDHKCAASVSFLIYTEIIMPVFTSFFETIIQCLFWLTNMGFTKKICYDKSLNTMNTYNIFKEGCPQNVHINNVSAYI